MIKRIIILTENRFGSRDYERFGVELLKQNGFAVEVWDLSLVLHPKIFNAYIPPDVSDLDNLVLYRDMPEAEAKLSVLSKSDFIINVTGYNFKNLRIYRAISKSRADYAVFYANIPEPIVHNSGLGVLYYKLKRLASLRHLETWKHLMIKLPFKLLGIRTAKIAFAAGIASLNYNYPVDKKTEAMYIHTLDYDIYLKEKAIPYTEKPMAVFLDEFLPFAFEFEMFGDKIPIDADRYYALLNRFFNAIEEKTGLNVVIAAHPRSTYETLPDYFNGRTCIRGKTIELIKECKLAVNHCTTAVNFANLFYKPVIFATCAALADTYEDYWIRAMAKGFGKKAVFMDNPYDIDFKKEFNVDRAQYDVYRKSFIKKDNTEDLPFWQIAANRLKEWKNI